jgi:hypothetical protein
MPAVQLDQALAETMVNEAIQACAYKKFGGDIYQTTQALRLGRCDICSTLSDCLVRQIGDYLGHVDKTVKAVYKYEPEYATLNPYTPAVTKIPGHRGGINLVAWVERKSAALSALSSTLETVISESRRKIPCQNATPGCYILDLQMVEDREVEENRGQGLVINSQYVHSMQVWKRSDKPERGDEQHQDELTRTLQSLLASFDTEYTPEHVLFDQAKAIEQLPVERRKEFEHRLREIKVALIRRMISDHLLYINIAKDWFTFSDLEKIFNRKIGLGRIGGKAAGMLLAERIIHDLLDESVRKVVTTPESYFMGSDLIYIFMAMNGLMHWNNQKYKSEEQIRNDYPLLREQFLAGKFPPEIRHELIKVLEKIGSKPVIVRSSSLLEDNFGTTFAGKYESYFCPNQGTLEDNLNDLTQAIAKTYSSTLKPDALLYRRSKGLQDYDERMAILIQEVQGERHGDYFLPLGAGVGFSRNLYRWAPQIRRDSGFVRLVWGLGTRAVERVGNDYPRLVALSHPTLVPDDAPEAISYYSQQYVDLIDIQANQFKSLPIHDVLTPDYDGIRYIAQLQEEGYISTPRKRVLQADIPRLVITYDELLRRSNFPASMEIILHALEEQYRVPVDIEFTLSLADTPSPKPEVIIHLLQCRPQAFLKTTVRVQMPKKILPERIAFNTTFMVPEGYLGGVRYVIFVDPRIYFSLPSQSARNNLRKSISQLNAILPEKKFICVGPGRWGTINPDLGVFVAYADIDRTGALIELSGEGIGPAPEPSLGTHFFQDLMEANIYPIAIHMGEKETGINQNFFYSTSNTISQYIHCSQETLECLKLIDIEKSYPGFELNIVMDDEINQAVGFLKEIEQLR